MKVVIWAGGLGSRISEESHLLPKPMIEIGGKPILWHIMKIYSHYGYNDFIICLGYKQEIVKQFFANYIANNYDVTFDMRENKTVIHETAVDPWSVTLADTGLMTGTAGRLPTWIFPPWSSSTAPTESWPPLPPLPWRRPKAS